MKEMKVKNIVIRVILTVYLIWLGGAACCSIFMWHLVANALILSFTVHISVELYVMSVEVK